MSVEIKFCGASGIVTGSSYMITVPGGRFLIDCGMFQGTKTVRELNYSDFGFNPADISFVLLTHAHIDHSGLLPKLVKEGFTGKIFTTQATRDLLEYMLPDSANIQESEVRRLNKKNAHRGLREISPIYTNEDATKTLEQLEPREIDGWFDLPLSGVKARLWNAGHILGAVSIEVKIESGETPVHILFSGDLGPENKTLETSPESPSNIDYLVVESTYGDRTRPAITVADRRQQLKREILEAVMAKGNIIIPSFAVERTQELLLDLDWLMDHNELPSLPLFIDSPLATKVTEVFKKHNCLPGEDETCPFHGKNVRYTQTVEESKSLSRIKSGAIIMAASGMCEAGRIRYHLRDNLWNPKATVLFVGYQAEGTLGKVIQGGAKRVRIHGEEVDVKARIRTLDSYSAHADQNELTAWVKGRLPVAKNIFLTHGTEDSRMGFEQKLASSGINPSALIKPMIDEQFRLDTPNAIRMASGGAPRITKDQMGATDWHNDYAQIVLDLAETLRNMKSSEERHNLLNNLMSHIYKNGRAAKK